MQAPVATCVWRFRPELLLALHERLGPPVDTYANGSQTWLRGDGPDGTPIEWRLHPCPGFARPKALMNHQLFPTIVGALARGEDPELDPATIWGGLDAAPAYRDDLDPDALADALTAVVGLRPDSFGLVDLDQLGQAWERSGGRLDVTARLLELLADGAPEA